MGRVIQKFQDTSFLEFDRGEFDDWCVYLVRGGNRSTPRDSDYFSMLKKFSAVYTAQRLYTDFVSVYDQTSSEIDPFVLEWITSIASGYQADALEIEILFVTLYAGMIAEENRAGTKLGKRVKRLGMHQVLIENIAPMKAAFFSRDKKWQEIDRECQQRGF
jgi:hypothetical protein